MSSDAFTAALAESLRQRGVEFSPADVAAFVAELPPQAEPALDELVDRFLEACRLHGRRIETSALRKAALRLLPFLFLLYVVNIIDRSNISIARLQMVPGVLGEEE